MITSFVSGSNTYTFPTSPADQAFFTNFGNVKNFMQQLPGVNSGFDMFGEGRRPTEAGTIRRNSYLVSSTISGMKTLRDNINKMVDWGRGRLYDTLRDGSIRWCNCWLNAIVIREERHKHTDLFQPVQLTFATDDPFWYTAGTMGALLGSTFILGTSVLGGGTTTTLSGLTNDFTITNNGSAYTVPIINIIADTGKNASYPRLQRIVNGTVKDYVNYNGVLATGQTAYFDPVTQTYIAKGSIAYSDFSTLTPDGIRLAPGSNTLRLLLDNSADGAKVQIRYYERFI